MFRSTKETLPLLPQGVVGRLLCIVLPPRVLVLNGVNAFLYHDLRGNWKLGVSGAEFNFLIIFIFV
jgi:hypothetical protein